MNPGNSGGPLFEMYGNVIGIVNKKFVLTDNTGASLVDNMGFAITINEAKPIINDLLANGTITTRPVLGVRGSEINESRPQVYYGVQITEGFLIGECTTDNSRAVLAPGDIIIGVDGAHCATLLDIQTQLKSKKAGDTVTLTLIRFNEQGKRVDTDVKLVLSSSF